MMLSVTPQSHQLGHPWAGFTAELELSCSFFAANGIYSCSAESAVETHLLRLVLVYPHPRMQWITHVGGTVVCTVAESRVVVKAGEAGEAEDQSPEIQ